MGRKEAIVEAMRNAGFDLAAAKVVPEWNGFKPGQTVEIKDDDVWYRANIIRIAEGAKRGGETVALFLVRWGNSAYVKAQNDVRAV